MIYRVTCESICSSRCSALASRISQSSLDRGSRKIRKAVGTYPAGSALTDRYGSASCAAARPMTLASARGTSTAVLVGWREVYCAARRELSEAKVKAKDWAYGRCTGSRRGVPQHTAAYDAACEPMKYKRFIRVIYTPINNSIPQLPPRTRAHGNLVQLPRAQLRWNHIWFSGRVGSKLAC